MNQTPDFYTFVIYYNNGERQIYKLPRQGDDNTLAKRMDEFRSRDEMVLHTSDNKLILIPFQNVMRIEVMPFPDVYASTMLHGATLLED